MALAERSYAGVIDDLLAGTWTDPDTGRAHGIPIESIVIAPSLEGAEAELCRARHKDQRLMVVHDAVTRDVMGEHVFRALAADGGGAEEFVWQNPRCTEEGVAELAAATAGAEALIAVGSGTVSDSVKYATFLDGRSYSVFATSPMNAYTTSTASVAFGGMKRSVPCHNAKGVFFDLGVLARCPHRLVAAAFADVICRTTAQVDWLLSHLLFGTPYSDVAYKLIAVDEDDMIAHAAGLARGEQEALATLTRVSAIMGLSTSFTGTTHVGSMAEHMISHTIDMFAGAHDPGGHPGTSHGEQVGVATLTVSRLHNAIFDRPEPPKISPTTIPDERLRGTYGTAMAATMVEATRAKAPDVAALNETLARDWPALTQKLRAVMRPHQELAAAMGAAGCQRTAAELGLSPEFYRQAVLDARFIRDRYSVLDLADDAGLLEPFLATLD